MKMTNLITLALLICTSVLCQQSVIWNEDPAIQTGQYLLINNSVPLATLSGSLPFQPAYTYTINYPNTFINFPSVCTGIVSLELTNQTNTRIFLQQSTASVSQTGYQGRAQLNGTVSIIKLRISLIACDEITNNFLKLRFINWSPSNATQLSNFNGLNTGSGYRSILITVTRSTSIDLSHTNYQLPFIKSFVIEGDSTDGMVNLGIRFNNVNSTNYNVLIWTSDNCRLHYAAYYSITFDQTIIEETRTTFSDSGIVLGVNGVQTTNSNMIFQKPNNFFIGVNYFSLNFANGNNNFDMNITYPNTLTTTNTYILLNFTYFNYRVRQCPPTSPYYNQPTQLCYATCPDKTYLNTTGNFCSPCQSSCLTCINSINCTTCNISAGVYLDSTAICVPCNTKCNTCSSATQCITCDGNLGRVFNPSTKYCQCKDGKFDNGPPLCTDCNSNCLTCIISATNCTTCNTSAGVFLNTGTSTCDVCDIRCLTCVSLTICLTCKGGQQRVFNPLTQFCDCKNGFYDNSGADICLPCSTNCLICNSAGCLTCNILAGVYLNLSTGICDHCHYSCATCNNLLTCLNCNISHNRVLNISTSKCDCKNLFFDNGVAECVACPMGCLICDSTGCMLCNITAGYSLTTTAPFICILPNISILFSIVSVIKQPTCNNLSYILSIENLPNQLLNTDLSKVFDFGLPSGSKISVKYDPVRKLLYAQAAYLSNIQSADINITLDPKNSGLPIFSESSKSNSSYKMLSQNNMAANYYPEDVYSKLDYVNGLIKAMLAVCLVTFVAGLYSGKVVTSELFGVMQISYLGLTLVQYGSPLMWPFKNLKLFNGLNLPLSYFQQGLPPQLTWLEFYNSLANNLNLMLLLPIAAIAISITFFVISRIVKHALDIRRFQGFYTLSIGQYLLTALLFCVYNFSSSLSIFIVYAKQEGKLFIGSIVEIALFAFCMIGILTLYSMKDKIFFGEFKQFFQSDPFSQKYYLVPFIERIIIGCLLGACRQPFISGIITIVILVVSLVLVAIKRPYVELKQNIRAITNYVISIIIISIYLSLSGQANQYTNLTESSIYVPIAVLVFLLVAILMNLAFVIFHVVITIKKHIEALRKKQTSNNFFTETNMQSNMQASAQMPKQQAINENSIEAFIDINFELPTKKRRRKRGGVSTRMSDEKAPDRSTLQIHDNAEEKVEVYEF